jgi:acetyltransferase
LSRIFRATSVAVVGASRDPTKRGHQALRALRESGYPGAVYPVNPQATEILGMPAARSVSALAAVPDVALVCTPAATVPAVLQECGRKGVGGAIVLAVGASSGPDDPLETAIRTVSAATGLRVLGPNTAGFSNFPLGLNLVGIRNVRAGRLALLTQSGNLGLALIQEAMTDSGAGIGLYIGVGNEADLRFDECLEFLGDDPDTHAVLMYVEGFRHGRRFVDLARRVTGRKPVVLLKGGRSERGGAAVSSHTGAVAGTYPVFRAAMRQAGVTLVERADELFAVGAALGGQPPLSPDGGIAVLADGGGHATLAVDALSEADVPLATFADGTRDALRRLAGEAAAVANPIDLAGAPDQHPLVFARALDIVLADAGVSGVLITGLFGGYAIRFDPSLEHEEEETARLLAQHAGSTRKPVTVHTLYGSASSPALDQLRRAGVPVLRSLEVACRCIAALHQRRAGVHPAGESVRAATAPPAPGVSLLSHPRLVVEPDARVLLAEHGVPMLPAAWCRTPEDVRDAVRRLGAPVALKAVSPHLPHKTDGGGVELGLGEADAPRAFERMVDRVAAYLRSTGHPPEVQGALVTPMAPPPVAELLIGVRRDPAFGPVLVIGTGGIAVEVFHDVALRLLPVTTDDVLAALDELSIAPLLTGLRGRKGVNRRAVAELALNVAACATAHPDIVDVEINPVFAYGDRAVAVDIRVFVREHA